MPDEKSRKSALEVVSDTCDEVYRAQWDEQRNAFRNPTPVLLGSLRLVSRVAEVVGEIVASHARWIYSVEKRVAAIEEVLLKAAVAAGAGPEAAADDEEKKPAAEEATDAAGANGNGKAETEEATS